MRMLGRMIGGALAGGVAGSVFGNDRNSTVGGMIAGAVAGAAGMGRINALAGRIGKEFNIGGNLSRAAIGGIRGITRAGRGLGNYYGRSVFSGPGGASVLGMAAGRGASMMRPIARGLGGVNRLIKRNTPAVNKYGGYAMATIGAAAAERIGSTIMNSNQPRR